MGRKDQAPLLPEALTRAQTALQDLNRLSAQAARGDTHGVSDLTYSLIPPGPDETPIIYLDEEALVTLTPREKLAFWFANRWAQDLGYNFGFDSQIPAIAFFQLLSTNQLEVSLGRAIQGILHPDKEFGRSVVENMIQANEDYRTLVAGANELSTEA